MRAAWDDIERFKEQKDKDLREALINYAIMQISMCKKVCMFPFHWFLLTCVKALLLLMFFHNLEDIFFSLPLIVGNSGVVQCQGVFQQNVSQSCSPPKQ